MNNDNHIIDFIKRKIEDFTSYDDFVVLATFGFIVLTNDEYKTYFNNYATKQVNAKNTAAAAAASAASGVSLQIEDLGNDDWVFEESRVFEFVSMHLLKTDADPSPVASPVASPTHITVDLNDIKFGDSFTISFNNSAQLDSYGKFDAVKTKENFEKNFVNLAQAFYETEFCIDISGVDNSDAINGYVNSVKGILNSDNKNKSLRVLYYNGKAGLRAKLDKNNFSKFVEFQTLTFNKLKTKIDEMNHNIKHQIIVLDDKKLTRELIQDKFFKIKGSIRTFQMIYTTIILVNDTIDDTSTLDVFSSIRIIHIKKGEPTSTTKTKIDTLTHQCTKIIPHEFSAEITKEQGKNKNITTILYNNDADLAAILKYAVLSNVVVFIESN
jgi:hypothetical protein